MHAGLGRQVRCRIGDRLDARLLVVGDDRHRLVWLFGCGSGLLQDRDLAVDAKHLRHLLFELRVTAFQVVAHLVRLHGLPVEDFAHGPLGQLGEAVMPRRGAMLARVAGQQPRRPQLVRIAQFLCLATGQVHQPSLGRGRDRGLFARPRPIIERRQRTIGYRPLNAALDGLMMHAQSPAHRKERRVSAIGEEHSRPIDPARRLRSRPRYAQQPLQILFPNRQFQNLTPRRHGPSPRSVNHLRGDKMGIISKKPKHPIGSLESIV